jgi:hypothetical protein
MTCEDLQGYLDRQNAVNEFVLEERRNTNPGVLLERSMLLREFMVAEGLLPVKKPEESFAYIWSDLNRFSDGRMKT